MIFHRIFPYYLDMKGVFLGILLDFILGLLIIFANFIAGITYFTFFFVNLGESIWEWKYVE